ncbi:MAG: DUF4112 domain-containing protein [Bdellovibrionales bacterium]
MPRGPVPSSEREGAEIRRRLQRLSSLLDSQFQLPNGWKFGWDGLLGLIPGLGDLLTNALSFYILYQAARVGSPPTLLIRMALNLLIDNAVDAVPLVGNIFDFIWKANHKNVQLLEDYFQKPHEIKRQSQWVVAGTLLFTFGLVVLCLALSYALAIWLWGLLRPLF